MKPYLMLFFLLVISACKGKNDFTINGKINGSENATVFLYQRSLSGTFPVDSALVGTRGTFVLRGTTEQPNFYILFIRKNEYINLLVHPGDKFEVITDAKHFNRDYFVEGSRDSRLILKLVTRQAQTLDRITELSNEYEKNYGSPGFQQIKNRLDSLYEIIFNEHKQFSVAFISENPSSLVSLMALYQQLGKQAPVFDYKKDFRYFEQVDSALSIKYPGVEAVKDLNKKVTALREVLKVETGARAPAFVMEDIDGKPVSLSSLIGKVVLLNFWASWSESSMQYNRNLAPLYKKYRSRGFEVLQVSLDRSRESWLKAIEKDPAGWKHLCDLAYWDSPVAKAYRIEALPAGCLIDREGFIIARYMTHEELEQKLKDIFQ